MRFLNLIVLFAVCFLFSCKTPSSITNYLHQADTTATFLANLPEPKIQKNDLLSIKVYSQSANPITDAPYNLPESAGATGTVGFLVDANGNIEYPRLGVIRAEGLSKTELAKQIKSRLENGLNNPTVIVRFLNYRVTVLGEVRAPGTFPISTERVTVLEALGLAGDITQFGRKDTIKVVREVEGRTQIGYVDLSSGNLFRSPYYRLQQNDVVYVEQSAKRIEQEERVINTQRISIGVSIVSVILLFLRTL